MLKWFYPFQLALLFTLIAVAVARPEKGYGEDSGEENYEFSYNVKDESEELDFGHTEKKEDDKVEGYYYVLLPDTRTQKVSYYVDGDSGFVAEVSYEGEAEFESEESYQKKEKEYGFNK